MENENVPSQRRRRIKKENPQNQSFDKDKRKPSQRRGQSKLRAYEQPAFDEKEKKLLSPETEAFVSRKKNELLTQKEQTNFQRPKRKGFSQNLSSKSSEVWEEKTFVKKKFEGKDLEKQTFSEKRTTFSSKSGPGVKFEGKDFGKQLFSAKRSKFPSKPDSGSFEKKKITTGRVNEFENQISKPERKGFGKKKFSNLDENKELLSPKFGEGNVRFSKKRPVPSASGSTDRKKIFENPRALQKPRYEKFISSRETSNRYTRPSTVRRPEPEFDGYSFEDAKPSFARKKTATPQNKSYRPNRYTKAERPMAEEQNTSLVRLNRFIANSGVCARRDADILIANGEIAVNGKVITDMGFKVKLTDKVVYKGQTLNAERKIYLLLNKPKGFITTLDDPYERKTVMELVKNACTERIFPVGRLDRNTTGLLLLTNDGELSRNLSHPSGNVKKIYSVELDKGLTLEDEDRLRDPSFELEDGPIGLDGLSILSSDRKELGVQLHSGKNRIVRRIFESLGYDVVKLDRTVYADLTKERLPRGHWRFLTEQEVIRLKHFTLKVPKKKTPQI